MRRKGNAIAIATRAEKKKQPPTLVSRKLCQLPSSAVWGARTATCGNRPRPKLLGVTGVHGIRALTMISPGTHTHARDSCIHRAMHSSVNMVRCVHTPGLIVWSPHVEAAPSRWRPLFRCRCARHPASESCALHQNRSLSNYKQARGAN